MYVSQIDIYDINAYIRKYASPHLFIYGLIYGLNIVIYIYIYLYMHYKLSFAALKAAGRSLQSLSICKFNNLERGHKAKSKSQEKQPS